MLNYGFRGIIYKGTFCTQVCIGIGFVVELSQVMFREELLMLLVFQSHSANVKKPNGTMKIFVAIFVGSVFGFLVGVSSPTLSLTKVNMLVHF